MMNNEFIKGFLKTLALGLILSSAPIEAQSAGVQVKYLGAIPIQQLKLLSIVGVEKDDKSGTVLQLTDENEKQFQYTLPEESLLSTMDQNELLEGLQDVRKVLQDVIQKDEDGIMNIKEVAEQGLETYLNSDDQNQISSLADVIREHRDDTIMSQRYETILQIFEDIYMGNFVVSMDMYGFLSAEEIFNIASNDVMVQDFAYTGGGGGRTIHAYGERLTTWWLPDGTTGVDYEYSDTSETETNHPDGSRTTQKSVHTENADGSSTTTTTTTQCDGYGNCTTTTTVQECDKNNNCTTTTTSSITAESEGGHGPYFVVLQNMADFFSSQSGAVFRNEIMQYYLNQSSAINTQNRLNQMFLNSVNFRGSQVRIGF